MVKTVMEALPFNMIFCRYLGTEYMSYRTTLPTIGEAQGAVRPSVRLIIAVRSSGTPYAITHRRNSNNRNTTP